MIHFDFSFAYPRYSLAMAGDIAPEECIGLMGSSGAGKTTLLRLLAGLEAAQKGRMVVDEVVWFDADKKVSLPPQKRSVGMVFQNYALFPHMTVREQILYAADHQPLSWVNELIDLVGLEKLAGRYPQELSGGQQQRAALARALARKPQLLLLDEPLSAIDGASRQQLQSLLRTLHAARYLTYTVLVSHDITEVFLLTHRVLWCEKGRLVRNVSPRELFVNNLSSRNFSLSATVLAKHKVDNDWVVTLLSGQNIFDMTADEKEALSFTEGQSVELSSAWLMRFLEKSTITT